MTFNLGSSRLRRTVEPDGLCWRGSLGGGVVHAVLGVCGGSVDTPPGRRSGWFRAQLARR
ncbi:hypothetical protein ACQI5H_24510 [Mycobacterium heidelbergense]|uniref:hypothetical protein n=1 Tax=Mycobacterium heidelbergense TaxID=53376 RepID=UPI003CF5B2FE